MPNTLPFRYLAISDQQVCPEPVPERVNRLFSLGVPAVQLRDKQQSDRTRYEWLRTVGSDSNHLLVNGRWDLAVLSDADGVHCPTDGLPLDVMHQLGEDKLLYGASTHSLEEVRRAETAGADYVTFGPVFPTPSKPDVSRVECPGPEGLSRVTDETNLPVLALGGIGPDEVEACLDAGADGVAGIRALFEPEDPSDHWRHIDSTVTTYFGET